MNSHKALRVRRILKWSGLFLFCCSLCAFGISTVRTFSASLDINGNTWQAVFHRGGCQIWVHQGKRSGSPFYINSPGYDLPFIYPGDMHYVVNGKDAAIGTLVTPWLPLTLVAVPTLFLWWKDRALPPGLCTHCRYNLTGNTSGICPECGTVIAKENVRPKGVP